MTISSPCIKRCVIGDGTGLCLGCGRTLVEIARWSDLTERERLTIMAQLPARLEGAAEAAPDGSLAGERGWWS